MADRFFLGVPLPEAAREALAAALDAALTGAPLPGRAVPPRNWHLTLRFLGNTAPAEAARIRTALSAAALGARFPLRLAGAGAFPRAVRAAVLWCGVAEGGGALAVLASAVEAAVVRAGWPAEPRSFSPHLTLARVRPPEDVRPLLPRLAGVATAFQVADVVLFHSVLGGAAPRYEPVERWMLG